MGRIFNGKLTLNEPENFNIHTKLDLSIRCRTFRSHLRYIYIFITFYIIGNKVAREKFFEQNNGPRVESVPTPELRH